MNLFPIWRECWSVCVTVSDARGCSYDVVIRRYSLATGHYAFTTLSCNCRARELLRARTVRKRSPWSVSPGAVSVTRCIDFSGTSDVSHFFPSFLLLRHLRAVAILFSIVCDGWMKFFRFLRLSVWYLKRDLLVRNCRVAPFFLLNRIFITIYSIDFYWDLFLMDLEITVLIRYVLIVFGS